MAVDGLGNVFVADRDNHTIRKVTPEGVVTTLAGYPGFPSFGDGTGDTAYFHSPSGVAVDSAGDLVVADTDNNMIRKVTPSGVVTTLAGLAESRGSADGTGSQAMFSLPSGVAVDGAGNVFVADRSNYTIRKVTPEGVVTTLAGLAEAHGSVDGEGADARFSSPSGVAVDNVGNVFVADGWNGRIRKVTPAGVVTTVGGGPAAAPDSPEALFDSPYGVTVDSAGTSTWRTAQTTASPKVLSLTQSPRSTGRWRGLACAWPGPSASLAGSLRPKQIL